MSIYAGTTLIAWDHFGFVFGMSRHPGCLIFWLGIVTVTIELRP